MVIIVTGGTGSGKTTICQKLFKLAQNKGYNCGGILTYKANGDNLIIEDIQTGEKKTLANSKNLYDGPRTPRYFFNPEGVEFGIKAIDRGTDTDILLVDEIGHLELRGEGFYKVIELIQSKKIGNCILVIRKELLTAFLPKLNSKPLIFETTIDNRERLPLEIYKSLAKARGQ